VITLKRIPLLLALAACLAAAGCGSDDEGGKQIPRAQAQALETRLSEAERRLDDGSAGACRDILNDTQPAVREILTSIPTSVDPDVRDALSQSFDNLWNLVDDQCQNLQPDEPTQTETTPPEATTTETTPPETTETTPPPTDTQPTTPEEQPLPPEGDGENGGAVPPDGNGNGGGVGPGAVKEKKEKGE
jgi:hypothetical protein